MAGTRIVTSVAWNLELIGGLAMHLHQDALQIREEKERKNEKGKENTKTQGRRGRERALGNLSSKPLQFSSNDSEYLKYDALSLFIHI